jgi:DNA repair exonuclease SbcCD ATPase subunit/DNA repair exonuclease SbcCD nuclease subunit
MRIALIGDVHLRARRLADVSEAWDRAVSFAKDNDAIIVQAGDIFDHYNVYGREASTGTVYKALLKPFSGDQPKLYCVIGNHDQGGPQDMDPLATVEEYPWVGLLARQPCVFDIHPEVAICAMPWLNRAHLLSKIIKKGIQPKEAAARLAKGLESVLERLKKETAAKKAEGKAVIFVGHLEVTGSKLDSGLPQANGLFEFSPAKLADLDCDAYAIGHIHLRQHIAPLPNKNDGYLGSLCQLKFGEERNETGFRLLDITGGKICKDSWVNNGESPRYYTVSSLQEADYRKGVDYVKIKCEARPEELPEGVIFEKVVSSTTSKRRLSERLDASMPLERLLTAWATETKCEIPLPILVSAAERLAATAEAPSDAIGSLQKIESISLRNIAYHSDTDVDLSDVDGTCGIEGPTGSGKTTLIESVPLSFYGKTPRSNIHAYLSRSKQEGSIEVGFESGGRHYVVKREIRRTAKTLTHKAYVFEKGTDKPIAGPNTDDVAAWCKSAIGDPDMVWAGAFSSQEDANNILDVDPADRKGLFAKLLNTDWLIKLGAAAGKSVQADTSAMEVKKEVISRLQKEMQDEDATRHKHESVGKGIEGQRSLLSSASSDLAKAKAEVAAADKTREERQKAIKAIADLKAQRNDVQSKGRSLKAEKQSMESLDTEAIKARLDKARKAKERIASLRASAVSERASASRLREERGQRLMQATSKANAALEKLRTDSATLRTSHSGKLNGLEMAAKLAKAALEEAEKKAKLLKGFPDKDVCGTCSLATDGIAARTSIPELKKDCEKKEKEASLQGEVLAKFDEETAKETQRLLAMVPKADDFDRESLSKADAHERLAASNDEEAGVASSAGESVDALEAELERARTAKSKADKMDLQLEALRDEFRRLEKEEKAVIVPDEPDDAGSKKRADELQSSVDKLQDSIAGDSKELGRLEAALEAYARKRSETQALEKELGELSNSCAVSSALAKAFGRDGIPQLIVDGAIPRFEEIMSSLLSDFDGRWSMRVLSQGQTAKGKITEIIEILIDDGMGERELQTYSGGEKKILRGIVRIAFAMLQAERSGKGLQVLVLDEATDMMDLDVSQTFIRMLKKASSSFRQVFVVSHSDHVLSEIPMRLCVSRQWGTTRVTKVTG